jgi:predicted ribosome quality control (RQC) complex YloA/Tae2 family protein
MYLRKHLGNAFLRSVEQVGSERMLKMGFSTKDSSYFLFIELFGKGNLVVTDPSLKILNAAHQQKWADREIKKGLVYSFPKRSHDFSLSFEEFSSVLSDKEIVLSLAKDLGLGGVYAEEICLLSGADKKSTKVSDAQKKKLYSAFQKLLDKKIDARVVYDKEKIKDIQPFALETFAEYEQKKVKSFSAGFDVFFQEEYAEPEEFVSKHQQQIDKTQGIISQQEKQIASLEKKAVEMNKKGELLYEHYQEVDEILKEIKKARATLSFDEISLRVKGHKIIKRVDGKNKKVIIDL